MDLKLQKKILALKPGEKKMIKTWARASTITPEMVGFIVNLHNGKDFLPVRVVEYALRDDSGGVGLHRGGDGIRRVYEFTAPATVTFNTERRRIAPYGLAGGEPGKPGVNRILRGGIAEYIPAKHTTRVNIGDRVVIETPGGGGWGRSMTSAKLKMKNAKSDRSMKN